MKKILWTLAALLMAAISLADTPAPGTVKAKLFTGDGLTGITATGTSLNVDVTNSISAVLTTSLVSPAFTQTVFGGAVIDPRTRQWALSSLSDSVTAFQGGAPWTIGLPSGASTSALQSTGNASLASILSTLQGTLATSVSNFPATQPISAASLPLPTNAAQETGGHLASIDSKIQTTANGIKVDLSGVVQPVSGTVAISNFPASQNVNVHDGSGVSIGNTAGSLNVAVTNGAITNPSVSATGAAVPSSATFIGARDPLTNLRGLMVSSAGNLLVDGSTVTQPVSGSISVSNFPATQPISAVSLPLPTNAAQETGGHLASLDTKIKSGQQTMANSVGVVIASDQSAVPVSGTVTANQGGAPWTASIVQGGNTAAVTAASALKVDGSAVIQPISGSVSGTGNFTVVQPTGSNLHSVIDSGTVTANIGSAGPLALDATVSSIQGPVNPGTAALKSGLIGGVFNSTLPTLINGQQSALQADSRGRLVVAPNLPINVQDGSGTPIGSALVGGNQSLFVQQQGNVTSLLSDGTHGPVAVKPAATAANVSDPSLVVAISPNSAITVTSVPPTDNNIMSTITAACPTGSSCPAGSTVQIVSAGFATLGFETHGTWVATLTQDVSFDPTCSSSPGTALWYQTAAFDTDQAESTYITSWGNSLNNDPWVMNIAGAQCARLRASSYTSGTVNVSMDTGVGASHIWTVTTGNIGSGSVDAGNPVKIGGVYNSSLPVLSTGQRGDIQIDSSARVIVSPLTNSSVVKSQLQDNSGNGITSQASGPQHALDVGIDVAGVQVDPRTRTWTLSSGTDSVSAAQSGTWTVAQGTAAALSGKWPVGITDGTSLAAVKAASASAVASDPSLVTALSPNTPLPAGSNVLGGVTQSGTWTVQQGTPPWSVSQSGSWTVQQGSTPTTLANAWPTKPTDGTNAITIKAASTAAGVSDTSLVIAVSPNSALPAGSNVIGAVTQSSGPWTQNMTQVGGSALTLGQKAMTASVPVVLASDQSGINTFQDKSSSGTISANGQSVAVSQNGSASLYVDIRGIWVGTIQVQGSTDGTNYVNLLTATGPTGAYSTAGITANGGYRVYRPAGHRFIQVISTAWTSGSATITTNSSAGPNVIEAVQLNAANNIGSSWTDDGSGNPIGSTAISAVNHLAVSAQGNVASGTSDAGNPVKIGGVYNTTHPTLTNGQRGDLQVSSRGAMIVSGAVADGAAPENNSVHVSGVDPGGLKRTVLTDTSGRVSNSYNASYANINTATTTTVKSGAGVLFAICYNTEVNNATITIYDNTTAAAPTIGKVTELVGGGADTPSGCSNYGGMAFNTGLTIVTSAAVDITVLYK